jgi:quercetin dioxygenase-like cupin family protein
MPQIERFPDFLTTLPEIELPFPGARGWLIQGDKMQIVFIEFSDTIEVPEHAHAEQWEFVVSGRMELRREGTSREHGAGDNFFIPFGVPHSATVQAGYRAIIVFNEPGRYKRKA